MRGCGVKGEAITLLDKERVDTCPLYLNYTHPAAFNRLLRLYRHAEKGILPEPGALEDQAAPLVAALTYVGHGTDEVQTALTRRRAPGAQQGRQEPDGG